MVTDRRSNFDLMEGCILNIKQLMADEEVGY
jgi:hypothetical protein